MARLEQNFEAAEEVTADAVIRSGGPSDRRAIVRFLAARSGWREARQELNGAFACPALNGGKE